MKTVNLKEFKIKKQIEKNGYIEVPVNNLDILFDPLKEFTIIHKNIKGEVINQMIVEHSSHSMAINVYHCLTLGKMNDGDIIQVFEGRIN